MFTLFLIKSFLFRSSPLSAFVVSGKRGDYSFINGVYVRLADTPRHYKHVSPVPMGSASAGNAIFLTYIDNLGVWAIKVGEGMKEMLAFAKTLFPDASGLVWDVKGSAGFENDDKLKVVKGTQADIGIFIHCPLSF